MTQKLHDPACYDLATHFLGAACSEHLRSDLARHIQDAVEDWIMMNVGAPGGDGAAHGGYNG
jgi:hypothetical protein